MTEKKEFKLEQTNSKVKLQGVVTRLDTNEDAYKMGTSKNNNDWRSLRFMVKTKHTDDSVNEIPVELFGIAQDEVYAYNKKEKQGKKFKFAQRNSLPAGYHMFGDSVTRVSLEKDEKGKAVAKNLHNYDAVEEIFNNLSDGVQVYVTAHIEVSSYEAQDGSMKEQKRYHIDSIGLLNKALDFDAEDFKETAAFEQEMIIVDVEVDKEEKKAMVIGRTISYGDNWEDGTFHINYGTEEGKDTELENLAKIFNKLSFGDFVKVYGKVVNRMEMVEEEIEEEEEIDKDNPFAKFTGKEKDQSLIRKSGKRYINELQIEGVEAEAFIQGKYGEDDFVKAVEEEVVTTENNPFLQDEEDDELEW